MKEKHVLRFFLDAGSGICLWAGNDLARQQFGYPVKLEVLPLSEALIAQGQTIIDDYDNSIDWNNPSGQTLWVAEECYAFNKRVEKFTIDLQNQLEQSFIILSEFQPITKYKSTVGSKKIQAQAMGSADFEKIEKQLNVKLPQDYKAILSNYPSMIQAAYEIYLVNSSYPELLHQAPHEMYLSNNRIWIIKQNKMVRKAQNSSCPKKDWASEHFVIGEDGQGNRYYINLYLSASPVYLYDRENFEANDREVVPNLMAWRSLIVELLAKNLTQRKTRCPKCQLLGGSEFISSRTTPTKILEDTEYETTYRVGKFSTYKCRFCRHRWEEDQSRTYKDVEYP